MTNTGKIITAGLVGAVAVFALVTLVDVDVSGDLKVPAVEMSGGDIELPEIQTSGGEMPDVDVNTADVEVTTEEKTIEIPSVDVQMPEENTKAEQNDLQ